ncbi:MAG: MFS transporter [Gordonibacter pamelaeae]|uniref:MFS transporter n=1 Tax=Gordonibacter pamelaeae TaxID=471189 RepID=UPI001D0701E6|nr:MFS transporter [Gordonibacter pamelaeae]MBS4897354.1 MFS transporter [Gordonibacter pamelaeae]MCB6311520.1 MFS transporter [Gordonibacter pamelaeae]
MGKVYVSDIIEQPGGGRFSARILMLVGLAMVFDGFDYMIVSFTMPQITEEMQLGFIATGSLASFSLLGMLVGGFLSGYLADRYGRKHVMNASIMLYALLTVPVFFVTTYDAFAVCRIMSGIGIGAVIPLSVTLVSEFAPTRHRGAYITATKTFMMAGWVLAGLTAMFVVPNFGWRMCYLVGGFPFLYGVLMHFVMPESVQWLLSKGRTQEALGIVNAINASLDAPKEGGYTVDEIEVPNAEGGGQLRALVSKKYLKTTVGIWLVAFTTCALSYGLTNWMPTVLLQSGYSVGASYGYTTLMNLLGCAGAVVAGLAADRLGRIRSAYMAFLLAGLAVAFTAVFGFGGLMIPACALMGFAINYAYMSPAPITIEAYPTEIRATGQACVTTVARIGGFITPMAIGGALESGSTFSTVLVVFLVPLCLAALFTKLLIKTETKGVALEDLCGDTTVSNRTANE